MRIGLVLSLGAGLASAAPLSILVSTTEVGIPRLGRPAVMPIPAASSVHIVAFDASSGPPPPSRIHHLCSKMRSGVNQLMSFAGVGPVVPNDISAFAALPVAPPHRPAQDSIVPIKPMIHPYHHDHQQVSHYKTHKHCSFLSRVHHALMTLGPWEGRAVAFVLGCGIGVLLRMVWVLTMLFFRGIRGNPEDERAEAEWEYQQVAVLLPPEVDAEEIFVAPPEYTDEKRSENHVNEA